MVWPGFPVSFSPETVADGSNDSIRHMYVCMYVSITAAVTTLGPAPELLKAHFWVLMSWWREVGCELGGLKRRQDPHLALYWKGYVVLWVSVGL